MILSPSSLTIRLLVLTGIFAALALVATGVIRWTPGHDSCGAHLAAGSRVTTPPAKPQLLVELPDARSIGLEEIAPGKRVAIIVMKGTWCSVCTSQLQRLQARAAEFESAGAVVVGMTDHSPSQNARAAAKLELGLPILSDADGDAILSFGLAGESHPVPGVVFLDEDGSVIEVRRGRYPGRPQEEWILEALVAR